MEKLEIKIQADAKSAIKEVDKLTDEIKKLDKQTKTSNKTTKSTAKAFDSVGKSASSLGTKLLGIATGYAAITTASNIVSTTANIEEGFIGVAKTTGLAGEAFDEFKDSILELSTEMAGISVEGLQQIAEIGGQMGIEGADNILTFTEQVGKMSVALDLSAEEVASSMAKIALSTGTPITEIESLG